MWCIGKESGMAYIYVISKHFFFPFFLFLSLSIEMLLILSLINFSLELITFLVINCNYYQLIKKEERGRYYLFYSFNQSPTTCKRVKFKDCGPSLPEELQQRISPGTYPFTICTDRSSSFPVF